MLSKDKKCHDLKIAYGVTFLHLRFFVHIFSAAGKVYAIKTGTRTSSHYANNVLLDLSY